jgi:type II secretory pathway pseudopilin PulG
MDSDILRDERGWGLVEVALAVVVVAIVGALLYGYLVETTRTLETVQGEGPLSQAKLTADRATLTSIRTAIQIYYGQQGQWPPTKDAVAALLNPPPSFQCSGNDYRYDAASGQVSLVIDDPGAC